MAIEINAVVATKIGFASHQNAVPLLADLQIRNLDAENYQDLVVELTCDPAFVEPRSWWIDQLSSGSSVYIADRDVKLDAGLLGKLIEAINGGITIRIFQRETCLASRSYPVELLGQSTWGGASSMSELLAAFVMPNDPAVDKILKSASEVLRRAGRKDAIDGYASKSRTRAWELTSAIWSAIVSLRISYSLPPASF